MSGFYAVTRPREFQPWPIRLNSSSPQAGGPGYRLFAWWPLWLPFVRDLSLFNRGFPTVNGGALLTPRGVKFAGDNDYINAGAVNPVGAFSLFARFIATATDSMAIARYDGTSAGDVQIWVENSSNIRCNLGAGATQLDINYPLGNEAFLWQTYDETTHSAENLGPGGSSGSLAASATIGNNSEPWLIGTDPDASGAGSLGNWFTGTIIEIRLYEGVVPASVRRQSFNSETRYDLIAPRRTFVPVAVEAGGAVALDGALASTSLLSGDLAVARPVAGALASVSALAGDLAASRAIAGALASTSATAGDLAASRAITGALASSSALNAIVARAVGYQGSLAALSALSADLTIVGQVALNGALSSVSALSGSLDVTRPLFGSLPASSALAGSLAATRSLAAALASTTALSGALSRLVGYDASLASISALSGDLSVVAGLTLLDGSLASQSALSGDIETGRALIGTLLSQSALTSALEAGRPISGSLDALSGLDGSIAALRPVTGSLTSLSALTGDFDTGRAAPPVRALTGKTLRDVALIGRVANTVDLIGKVA